MSNDDSSGGPSLKGELPLDGVGKLVELLVESGVGEIRVRQGELEITVKARTEAPVGTAVELIRVPHAPLSAPPASASEPETNGSTERDEGLHVVCSPLVGTFYRAPRPGEEPYVEVGDRVEVGQTLCLVEAMKLMNEIPADISGEVIEVLIENARGVEYDQPLFRIRPEA